MVFDVSLSASLWRHFFPHTHADAALLFWPEFQFFIKSGAGRRRLFDPRYLRCRPSPSPDLTFIRLSDVLRFLVDRHCADDEPHLINALFPPDMM